MPPPTKPPTIQDQWDQFCLDMIRPECQLELVVMLKAAFLRGVNSGITLMGDRLSVWTKGQGDQSKAIMLIAELGCEMAKATEKMRELWDQQDKEGSGS